MCYTYRGLAWLDGRRGREMGLDQVTSCSTPGGEGAAARLRAAIWGFTEGKRVGTISRSLEGRLAGQGEGQM